MREVANISPTSLHLWERDRDQFFIDRLADNRTPREGTSPAASVGSSFDAFVKCALHKQIYGHDANGVYDVRRLFESQVEDNEWRDFAWRSGEECFKRYQKCCAYAELVVELTSSTKEPKFEFTLESEVDGVPLIGKPDLYYYKDCHVLYDWKVQGFCSKHPQSPKKLYRACRDTWTSEEAKSTRGGGQPKPHKNYNEMDYKGHKIGSHWMDEVDSKWADQLCIYGWLTGIPVGSEDFIVGIDQLCCKPAPEREFPLIRVAQHRCRISEYYQLMLIRRLKDMYSAIQSGHIFDDMTREESDNRIATLEEAIKTVDPDEERAAIWDMCNEKEYQG